mgnify:CR=1 FL=1
MFWEPRWRIEPAEAEALAPWPGDLDLSVLHGVLPQDMALETVVRIVKHIHAADAEARPMAAERLRESALRDEVAVLQPRELVVAAGTDVAGLLGAALEVGTVVDDGAKSRGLGQRHVGRCELRRSGDSTAKSLLAHAL